MSFFLSFSPKAATGELLVWRCRAFFERARREKSTQTAKKRTGDDDKVGAGLEGVEHLDDVLVPQAAQDLDLLPQVAQVALALARLANELKRDHAARGAAAALVHLSVSRASVLREWVWPA